MLKLAKQQIDALPASATEDDESVTSPTGSRALSEVLIPEVIYPSLGEREKAIFVTSPVDDQKRRELESWRSLEAAVANGGERGKKEQVEEKEALGADIAI